MACLWCHAQSDPLDSGYVDGARALVGARPMGPRSNGPAPHAAVPERAGLEYPPAALVRVVQTISARDGRGATGDDRARPRERAERVRELAVDLRSPGCAGDGRSRVSVGDRSRADRHGWCAAGGDRLPRAIADHGAIAAAVARRFRVAVRARVTPARSRARPDAPA